MLSPEQSPACFLVRQLTLQFSYSLIMPPTEPIVRLTLN